MVTVIKTPELYELEYLFECEAQLSDEGIPWGYACVSFTLTRGNLQVEFDFEEAIGLGQLRLYLGEDEINNLHLENIHSLSIQRSKDLELLIIEFDEDNSVHPLQLQTKPVIKVTWGTRLD